MFLALATGILTPAQTAPDHLQYNRLLPRTESAASGTVTGTPYAASA